MSSSDDRSERPPPANTGALAALATRSLFVPLTGDAGAPFAVMDLVDGRRALPIFTSRAALERAAAVHGFRDRMGELRPGEAPGRLALGHVARAGLDAAVLDPGEPGSFVATRAEIDVVIRSFQRRAPSGSYQAARRPSEPLAAADRIRVLVVDDDATILTMVQRFLASRGAEVEVSSSALGVSGLVARHRPSVLVLDVTMPALDGAQIASIVRASAYPPAIVFFSAVDPARLAEVAASVPGAERVSKSERLDVLWDVVRRTHRARRA